jgi:protein-L-isoaspartate(D-aspartate) O-methyltransferase
MMNSRLVSSALRSMALILAALGCADGSQKPVQVPAAEAQGIARTEEAPPAPAGEDSFAEARGRMVQRQLAERGIRDPRVLEAMRKVPRHRFVPDELVPRAYDDRPLPIGHEQTISQPYIVAFMTEAVEPKPADSVLEIGTGSGYQAAILAEVVRKVYTIEIVEPLGRRAAEKLKGLGYENIEVKIGDGYQGWEEKAPFDAILVTCAPEDIPRPLIEQLKPGGRMIIPVGPREGEQHLYLMTKQPTGEMKQERVLPVRFVPMTGDGVNQAER